jgi:hypothetical protein
MVSGNRDSVAGRGPDRQLMRQALDITQPSVKGRADVTPDLRDTILNGWRTNNGSWALGSHRVTGGLWQWTRRAAEA